MGLESFVENEVSFKEIEELAQLFVDDGISYTKFKAKDSKEMEVFLKAYKEALNIKNGNFIEEEDKEVSVATK